MKPLQDYEIQYLKGVGPKRAELYHKIGVHTLYDLLYYFPRSYIDVTSPAPIASVPLDTPCAVVATVIAKSGEQRIRKGMSLYKVKVTDYTTELVITFFNQKYLAEKLEIGRQYLFYGKVTGNFLKREMSSPLCEDISSTEHMLPVYPLTEGLTGNILKNHMRSVLSELDDTFTDPLPDSLRKEYGLCHLRFALETIHFPKSEYDLSLARRRLIFDELLSLQLGLAQLKQRARKQTKAIMSNTNLARFYQSLPFSPTGAQRRAIEDAARDMERDIPMNRLVQGDVGSGKTLVAAAACMIACQNGWQSAFMAPTEILAEQHFRSLSSLLKDSGMRIGLLTGSMTAAQKREVTRQISEGELDLVIGTHALIQEKVQFSALGLVVTDEQHRFGVQQRSMLAGKGEHPHMLVMSATPIPRTLALIIYGDLDVSVIDELPPGRQVIHTYAIDSSKRMRAFGFVKKHIDEGRQAYIVCPLVEQGESDLKSATQYERLLREKYFSEYHVGLLHGKMKASEKDRVMRAFQHGEIDVLVSTTVIEVGVDVPNAVIMLIENAERFGLSQLHQLRGRVGRGSFQSYCILVSDAKNQEALGRLGIMCKTTDGFAIAEFDLKQRGPGDFFGHKQHGLPELKIADMMNDTELIHLTKTVSERLLAQDPELSFPEHHGLYEMTQRLFSRTGDAGLN